MATALIEEGPCFDGVECTGDIWWSYGVSEATFDSAIASGDYCKYRSVRFHRGTATGFNVSDSWEDGEPELPKPSCAEANAKADTLSQYDTYRTPYYGKVSSLLWVHRGDMWTPCDATEYACKIDAGGSSRYSFYTPLTILQPSYETTNYWGILWYQPFGTLDIYYIKNSGTGTIYVEDEVNQISQPCLPYYSEYADLEITIESGNFTGGVTTYLYVTGTTGVDPQQYEVNISPNDTQNFTFRVYFNDPNAWRDTILSLTIPAIGYSAVTEFEICSECLDAYCLDLELMNGYVSEYGRVLLPSSVFEYKAELIFDDWDKCKIDVGRTMTISYAGSTLENGVDFIGPTEIFFPEGELIVYFEVEILEMNFYSNKILMIDGKSQDISVCKDSMLSYPVLYKIPYSTCCDFVPKDFVAWSDYHNYDKFYGLEPFITKSKI